MLVIFPVYTSCESQIVLHWQKNFLCWRDSLDLNQAINKCFSTQVNASNFIMNFTLCLPENPKLLYACNRLCTKTPPLLMKSQLRGKLQQLLHISIISGYMVLWRGTFLLGISKLQEISADMAIYMFLFLCLSISSANLCFHRLFCPLLMRFLFKWGPLCVTCNTYENNCCV